jgi:hypothetical protein
MKLNFLILLCVLFFPFLTLKAPNRASRRNLYRLNISRNEFGLNPAEYICYYDDVSKQVTCQPVDPNKPFTSDTYTFNNVYVKKLTSDPKGIGFVGSFQNPNLNPGLPHEYTSTLSIFPFAVYISKY